MTLDKGSNLALLIDGDNVSAKIIVGLMAEVAHYGTASVRRIYGDWTRPVLGKWKACLLDHSILPIQQFEYTTGKNSTDGAMIIDAMDLLYTNRFSGFCLVSSDSDFTRLAARIREQGVTVYGFGRRETNNAFVAACNKFVYFDALSVTLDDTEEPQAASGMQVHKPVVSPPVRSQASLRVKQSPIPLDQAARDGLVTAVSRSSSYDGDWINLAEVGAQLSKISPDLNARNYGFDRLRDFVGASGVLDLKMKPMGDNPAIALVRIKQRLV